MAIRRVYQHALLAACVVGWGFCGPGEATAQVQRYQPQSPTVSPWLNLTRDNVGGGLSNYHALVRPQIQQQRINRQEQAMLRQQGRQLSTLQSEFQRGLPESSATGTGSWFMTPGNQTSFQDTSRFYPQPVIRGRFR